MDTEKSYAEKILDIFLEMDERLSADTLSDADRDIRLVLGTMIFALQNAKMYELMQYVNEWRTGVSTYMMRDAAKLLKMEQEENADTDI